MPWMGVRRKMGDRPMPAKPALPFISTLFIGSRQIGIPFTNADETIQSAETVSTYSVQYHGEGAVRKANEVNLWLRGDASHRSSFGLFVKDVGLDGPHR